MNPNNLSHLDPKLKEAYERVMGTTIPAQAQTPSPAPTTTPAPFPTVSAPTPVQEPQSQMVVNKKKVVGLSPILVAVAVILFFLAYTIIWIKVFNLKVPFLP